MRLWLCISVGGYSAYSITICILATASSVLTLCQDQDQLVLQQNKFRLPYFCMDIMIVALLFYSIDRELSSLKQQQSRRTFFHLFVWVQLQNA